MKEHIKHANMCRVKLVFIMLILSSSGVIELQLLHFIPLFNLIVKFESGNLVRK